MAASIRPVVLAAALGCGLACSAFTSSQLVAAVSGWAIAFVLWDLGWISSFVSEPVAEVLDAHELAAKGRFVV